MFACFVGALCISGGAYADETTEASHRFQLDPVQPASPQSPFLTVEGPTRPDPTGWRRFSVAWTTDYARSPLTVHATRNGSLERIGTPVQNMAVSRLALGFQLLQSFSAEALVPVCILQSGDDVRAGNIRLSSQSAPSLGDVRLGIVGRRWVSPSFGFAIGVRGWLPTGDQQAYMGDGRARVELLGGIFAQTSASRLGCTLNASPLFVVGREGDRIALGCAVDALTGSALPAVGLEGTAAALTFDQARAPGSHFELWGRLREQLGAFAITLAAGPGAGSSPGTAAWRALASLTYAPQGDLPRPPNAGDRDLDGIPDRDDACPSDAGPASQIPTRNGCPELDSDGDGVPNHLDACPEQRGVASTDKTVSGCPDSDNDHVVDKLDRCPHEPAEASSDPDTLGCPRRARLRNERFVIYPPLSITGAEATRALDDEPLREIAFAVRADMTIRKVTVDVTLQGSEEDLELANRAVERATEIVKRLIDFGVDRSRLERVGGVSPSPASIEITISDRAGPKGR